VEKKSIRLIVFFVGIIILAVGLRFIYLKYHWQSPDRISGSGGVSAAVENERNPYLRGKRVSRTESAGDSAAASALPSPSPLRFAISTEDLVMGILGEDYRQVLEAVGGKGRLAWKLVAGELPPGLYLGREGIISGQPREEGEWRFSVVVEDRSGQVARKAFKLLVRKSEPPPEAVELAILTASLPGGSLGRDYLQEIKAEGGQLPYGWSLVEGSLPEGILLNKESGVLYGIPGEVGSFSFTIRVTDAAAEWVEMSYRLLIEEGEFEIVTAALPPAIQDQEYSLKLQAKGGVTPYRWEIVSGKLPLGIELDGEGGRLHGTCEWLTV